VLLILCPGHRTHSQVGLIDGEVGATRICAPSRRWIGKLRFLYHNTAEIIDATANQIASIPKTESAITISNADHGRAKVAPRKERLSCANRST
jgi:hypothetical protein